MLRPDELEGGSMMDEVDEAKAPAPAPATAAFVVALRTAGDALAAVPLKLEGARVHDQAFGKLFEAGEVRDAYHQRLPETEQDVVEAREVIEHFIVGLSGGHPIAPREDTAPAAGEAAVPAQAVPEDAQTGPEPAAPRPAVPEQTTGRSEP
jgi:hypothetical protein